MVDVDRVAHEEHRSRSELLREAMRAYMETRKHDLQTDRLALREPAAEWRIRPPGSGLQERDRQTAREFRRRLEAILTVLDLRIFGSRARGDALPDSDLDIFIEVETITPALRERVFEVSWEVGFDMDRVISPMVVTREELDLGAMGASPLVLNVTREGVRP